MSRIARLVLVAAAALGVSAALPSLALAKVRIAVDLDMQTMHVEAADKVFDWKVSSGKTGYDTPAGTFKVLWMDKDHHSDEYEQAYMPNAIFFAPGFAIHGFSKSPWGHKASHGCIRLPIDKSATLFDLVKADGGTAEITITGVSDREAPTVASVRAKQREAEADAYVPARPSRADGYGYPDDGYYDAPQPRQPPRGFDGLFGSMY